MNRKPNSFQKLIHQFVMLRPVTAFFANKIPIIDKLVLELTRGKYTLSEFAGWRVIQLKTIGAKTGEERVSPLIGLMDNEKIAVIASSFGRTHNPGWYYNLKANPECVVELNQKSSSYVAHEAQGKEYEHFWQLALSYYAGYENYKERASHRHIPIMVLEPKQ
jgi:deazaflavin-dependent oxidoreductase (nitroreductase family)